MKNSLRISSFIHKLLLLLFLISPSVLSKALYVSGAGATAVNGIYLLAGTKNGGNEYTQAVSKTTGQHCIF
jgi:hypothetical protein